MNFLFFGMGFSSRAAVRVLRTHYGDAITITGTTRSREKAEGFAADNIVPLLFDGETKTDDIANAIASATHIIQSIAPDISGDPVLNLYTKELAVAPNLKWVCYYSTVGVYGNFDGAWVDEKAELAPLNRRSQWRVASEAAWRELAKTAELPLAIFRLAGIYGPGRSQFEKLTNGTARRLIKPGQVFNRIHVEDIANVTRLAAEKALVGTYNMADDEPAPPQEVVTYAAKMCGLAPPEPEDFATATMTDMARSFYADNKRVSNAAIKSALGIDLIYPTYREGLMPCLAATESKND